ncbi:hypothetical protein ARMSODRAFT_1024668 [Armillaria solidipes]|uniref:Ribonuclease H1 N-terminal domain-containing protein n=1 Tax=Armillaria solidipes TaxID=1076256 RepID=A0A2H3BDL2_9AGAR|nr:hypothetical protein ARMSODRAFT_1024668 [Armillaria solidipes]
MFISASIFNFFDSHVELQLFAGAVQRTIQLVAKCFIPLSANPSTHLATPVSISSDAISEGDEVSDNEYTVISKTMTTTETTIICSPCRRAMPVVEFSPNYSHSTTPGPLSPSHTDVFTASSPMQYAKVNRESTPMSIGISKFTPATPERGLWLPARSGRVLSYHILHPNTIPRPVLKHPPITTYYIVFIGQEVGVFDDSDNVAERCNHVSGARHKSYPTFDMALAKYTYKYHKNALKVCPLAGSRFDILGDEFDTLEWNDDIAQALNEAEEKAKGKGKAKAV